MLFEQINDEGWARAYLIVDEDAALAVLVDPVLEFMTRDEEMLKRNGWSLACVMNTHTHADHVSSAVHLARKYDCPYLMHSSTSVPCAGLLVSDLEEHSFGADHRLPVRAGARDATVDHGGHWQRRDCRRAVQERRGDRGDAKGGYARCGQDRHAHRGEAALGRGPRGTGLG